MKELIDLIVQKLDVLTENMQDNNRTLERLTVTVEEHEKRSTQFEEYVKESEVRVQEQLRPVERYVIQVRAVISFVGFVMGGGIGTALLLYFMNRGN